MLEWGSKLKIWPDSDPYGKSEPNEIETYLKIILSRNQVSLLGEIDLQTPTDYADTNWSLLDLANYQLERRVMVKHLDVEPWRWKFPATLAIWSVGHAQISDEGGKLWEQLEGYSSGEKVKLAQKFTQSMEYLHFDLFENELQGAQKHSQLASIHAMIPDFAIRRFGEVVGKGVQFNSPKEQIVEEILQDSTISKGVARLFSARREMALDLVERTFNFIAYGYSLDLPERIINRLEIDREIGRQSTSRQEFPKIFFYESERRPIFYGASGWNLESDRGEIFESDSFPPVQIFGRKEDSNRISLFDPNDGFLVFNDSGKLMRGKRLPDQAGFLLWKNDVRILSPLQELELGYLLGEGWTEWNYSYFQNVDHLELALSTGELVNLNTIEKIQIEQNSISFLIDANDNPVLTSYPIIHSGQRARVSDNLKNIQFHLGDNQIVLGSEPNHIIDFTISAGLGKSTRIEGFVVPGLAIEGLSSGLIEDEKREIYLQLPSGWHFNYPPELDGQTSGKMIVDSNLSLEIIEFSDPAGEKFTTYLEIPVLSWSLVFDDREIQTGGSESKHLLEDRKHIESLILHGITDYLPILRVNETAKIAKQRGRDAIYDLRFLQQDKSNSETVITIIWNYREVNLMSFRKLERKKTISISSFSDLPTAAVEANLFTSEDWSNYQLLKQDEHIKYRNRLREARGRYR